MTTTYKLRPEAADAVREMFRAEGVPNTEAMLGAPARKARAPAFATFCGAGRRRLLGEYANCCPGAPPIVSPRRIPVEARGRERKSPRTLETASAALL